jgi:uncharacterized damage-inducible protein DinB
MTASKEHTMNDATDLLSGFFQGWREYQDHLTTYLAPLTAEQLDLRAAPNQRSIREIATHIIGGRARWFDQGIGETNEAIAALSAWDRKDQPARATQDIITGLETTWNHMQERIAAWSPDDLATPFERERYGQTYTLRRPWIIWHLLEHDLNHGGEIFFTLGTHGLPTPDL